MVIEAAGAVPWRLDGGALEVAVVHRPRYDDWSFPKGKLDEGEDHRVAAVREVREETGLLGTLGPELPETRYDDRYGRSKRVRYWAMDVTGGRFEPNDEVDELAWLPLPAARARLTYERDRMVLDALPVPAGPAGPG